MQSVEFAKELRCHALEMVHRGRSSHIGSVLSIADILAVLYNRILKVRPDWHDWPDRDRFILSKGHAGAGVYAALALAGFLEKSTLTEHYSNGSIFSGHVSHKGVPGVDFSTGSLGHGLSVATGMALGAKRRNLDFSVFCLLSDGEMNEGSNWEALMAAAHFRLSKLTAIIDYNKLQSLESTENTMGLEPLADKLSAFGWNVLEVDGHDHEALFNALSASDTDARPRAVIAHTTKGKGVSFMENEVHWHYAPPNDEQLQQAISEIRRVS